tara:strand:+ start:181 stop:1284 length:1104 start_codon:yes stop_codon:yes gene_type:complete
MLGISCVSSACLGDDFGVDDVIQLVRENESIYADIDVKVSERYTTNPDTVVPLLDPNMKISMENTAHIWSVGQNGMYRIEAAREYLHTDGTTHSPRRVGMSDGRTTRSLNSGLNVVNKIDGHQYNKSFFLPHMLMLRPMGTGCRKYVTLSRYLSGSDALRRDKDCRWQSGIELKVSYEGRDEHQGLQCHKLVITLLAGEIPHTRWTLWLAEHRNYIPVRMLGFTLGVSDSIPDCEGAVSELKELAPGIWCPMESHVTSYDPGAIQSESRQVMQWRQEYLVESISLDPSYPLSFFQEMSVPDGTAIYEMNKESKIVDSYRKGAPQNAKEPKMSTNSWWNFRLFLWGNAIFIGIVLVVMFVQKRRRDPK